MSGKLVAQAPDDLPDPDQALPLRSSGYDAHAHRSTKVIRYLPTWSSSPFSSFTLSIRRRFTKVPLSEPLILDVEVAVALDQQCVGARDGHVVEEDLAVRGAADPRLLTAPDGRSPPPCRRRRARRAPGPRARRARSCSSLADLVGRERLGRLAAPSPSPAARRSASSSSPPPGSGSRTRCSRHGSSGRSPARRSFGPGWPCP